jgi:gentisate 1,2-dioxygenase
MDAAQFHIKPRASAERTAFYDRLGRQNTAPLWEVLSEAITTEPKPVTVPVIWRYNEVRPLLMEAAGLLTVEEAERRVLVLENPGVPGGTRVTQSLYAGLQLIMPGETAPTHRHSMAALRFVVEGQGAYTSVDGERTTMHPGDFILTPSWTYHDHGNAGTEPVIWMDGLDLPLVNSFDASFAERHPMKVQPVVRQEGDALARYGGNVMPVDYHPTSESAALFSYPYDRSRAILDRMYRDGPVDPHHGVKIRYVNPATGGAPMPTMSAFLQLLPAGFSGAPYRSTDGTVFCVAEGRGRSRIGDVVFDWKEHDIFVAPSWRTVSHEANDAVLFSFSDRVAQQKLGIWREEKLAPSTMPRPSP